MRDSYAAPAWFDRSQDEKLEPCVAKVVMAAVLAGLSFYRAYKP